MRVQIAGRHMDVGDALRARITDDLSAGVEKYFARAADASVSVGRNGVGFEVDCVVHLASGISLQAHGLGGDAHAAFADALGKIETRVRRYASRLKKHHSAERAPLPDEGASAYVLAPFDGDDDEAPVGEPPPLVIAEAKIAVKTMTVSMAVLQLDLAESPALMFRNAAHGGLNVVYRRADGNIAWVDPAPRTDGA